MIEQRDSLERKLSGSRAFLVFVALLVAASMVGLIAGIRDDHGQTPLETAEAVAPHGGSIDASQRGDGTIRPAGSYLEMDAIHRVREIQRSAQARHQESGTSATGGAISYSSPAELDRLRLIALDERDDRRAFNGAPPIIPHPVVQWEAESCLACHQEGMVMGELRATKMPHELLTNCTQCHAPTEQSQLPWATGQPLFAASSFEGAPAPEGGTRAYEGAPPTIPHTLQLRNDCLSCHGPTGLPGIRTSHAERTNCFQCHAVQQPAFE